MPRVSPVTGRYVYVEVDDLEYKGFYLENGTGQPLVRQHTAYRVIAYDLPRHGKFDPLENSTWWTEEYGSPPTTTPTSSSRCATHWSWRTRSSWVPRSAATSRCSWPTASRSGSPESSRWRARTTPPVLPGLVAAPARQRKEVGHVPMSENYPVFRTYLRQALDTLSTATTR